MKAIQHFMSNLPSCILLVLLLSFTVQAGKVWRETFYSKSIHDSMEYTVIVPSSYTQQKSMGVRFPVVYLLHCAGCTDESWVSSESYCKPVDQIIDSVNFITVAPYDGNKLSWWLDSPIDSLSQFSSLLIKELKPRIDSLYATFPHRENTGIMGHSMGGFGAFHNARIHPEIFGAAFSAKGCFSLSNHCNPLITNTFNIENVVGECLEHASDYKRFDILTNVVSFKNSNVKLSFYTGNGSEYPGGYDFFYLENVALDSLLTHEGIAHEFLINGESHYNVPGESMIRAFQFFASSFTYTSVGNNKSFHPNKRHSVKVQKTKVCKRNTLTLKISGANQIYVEDFGKKYNIQGVLLRR